MDPVRPAVTRHFRRGLDRIFVCQSPAEFRGPIPALATSALGLGDRGPKRHQRRIPIPVRSSSAPSQCATSARSALVDGDFLWVDALLWPALGADRHDYGDDRGMDLGEKYGGNAGCRLGFRHPHAAGRRDLLFPRDVDEKLAHKRVGFAFLTDGRGRPVSRQDGYVVPQREQLPLNSLKQLWPVTAGQVPTTNAADKENITSDQKLFGTRKEAKATGAMTRDLEHLKFHSQKIALARFLDKKIGRNWFDFKAEAEVPEEIRVRNHRRGIRVTTDWAVKFSLNVRNIANVIDVPVSEEQQFQIDFAIFQPRATAVGRVK